MIERLNFYDVYGYLLPGLGLLGVIWFPFWFVAGYDLPAAWSSALVVLFLGYLVGHAFARLSTLAFPHGRVVSTPAGNAAAAKTAPPRWRSPSDYLLDRVDTTIAAAVKTEIITAIRRRFGVDVEDRDGQEADVDRQRRMAFMLCRRALLQHAVGSYAEQFEGLYTLMRGWATVAWISVFYYIGWAVGPWMPDSIAGVALAGLGIAFIVTAVFDYRGERDVRRGRKTPTQYDPLPFRLIAVAMVPLGGLLWEKHALVARATWDTIYVLIAAAVISALLGLRFHSAYHYFADLFAQTVLRDFFVLERYESAAGRTRATG